MTTILGLTNEEFLNRVVKESDWGKCLGLYWTRENGVYVGMDNTTGDCWVDEFGTLKECIDWLVGDYE